MRKWGVRPLYLMRTLSDRDVRMLVARSSVGDHHVPLDLASADLEMANLSHVDLRGANLAGANLRGAMLWGAKLDGACLDGTDFTCANLTWCTFYDCSMKGTLLIEADLDEATLDFAASQAITVGASMTTVSYGLSEAGAKRLESRRASGEESVPQKLSEAQQQALLDAHRKTASPSLRQRSATGLAQKYKRLRQAQARILSDADLEELLRFSVESSKPLNLRGCNLTGAKLQDAALDGACLAFANLTAANMKGASLEGADLTDAWGFDSAKVSEDWTTQQSFALTGLVSRGGLSNWTFFFFPQTVVLLDLGAAPAVKAGIIGSIDALTVILGDPAYGPQRGKQQPLLDWYTQLHDDADDVLQFDDAQIARVRLHLRMTAHELFITGSNGRTLRFTLMNRHEAEPVIAALQQRFGARFEVSSTALFSFLQRRAPFLTK